MRIYSLLWLAAAVISVKEHDFRKCHQASFCRRLRGLNKLPDSFQSPYHITRVDVEDSVITMNMVNTIRGAEFTMTLTTLKDAVRLQMDEKVRRRYDEVGKWILEPLVFTKGVVKQKAHSTLIYLDQVEVRIDHKPFKLTLVRDGTIDFVLNQRSLLHMEEARQKPVKVEESAQQAVEGQPGEEVKIEVKETLPQDSAPLTPDQKLFYTDEEGQWEEYWGGRTDSKPKGPEGLSIDMTFPGAQHVFGIPEHAAPLSLPSTDGLHNNSFSEPYRLFNVDIFEYLAHSEMALYGAVPIMHAVQPKSTLSVLLLVGSDMYIDVNNATSLPKGHKHGIETHWVAESGILDLLIVSSPTPKHALQVFKGLVGAPALPQLFALAHHQSRWNYISETDVLEVNSNFDKANIPMDVLWLDIEYANERMYFKWNENLFPDPKRMLKAMEESGRKMVAIVDPHVKRTDVLHVYTEARDLDILLREAHGGEYDGWCWTGSSAYVDFFNPKSWPWWISQFKFDKWVDSAKNLFIWNDMNEPSVFNGPEISAPRDLKHDGGWEHRDLHNLNGMLYQNVTFQALLHREDPRKRPFVLTRSFYTGSQKFGPNWSGDIMGTWEHFNAHIPVLLSNSIALQTFTGADVGGFFGDPSEEMLIRWYQAGVMEPFFRAHAHIDTKRREPFLLDPYHQHLARQSILLRHSMLPLWYTAFYDSHKTGMPIMNPHFVEYPSDAEGYGIDDQYFIGDTGILVKPVTTEGATSVEMYLPDDQPYYHYLSKQVYTGKKVTVMAPLDMAPILVRGGSILPLRMRPRRASSLTWHDPYTLYIAVSKDQTASGHLYMDDGESFSHEQGDYILRDFSLTKGKLTSTGFTGQGAWVDSVKDVRVERITIRGAIAPKGITFNGKHVKFTHTDDEIIIKDPGLFITQDWTLDLTAAKRVEL